LAAGLRTLSLIYLISVSAFGVAIALNSKAPWALPVQQGVRIATPYVKSAADTVNEKAVKPAFAWLASAEQQVLDYANPPPPVIAGTPPKKVAAVKKPALRPAIVAEPPKQQVASLPQKPLEIAPEEEATPAPLVPAPDATPPGPGEVARVLSHLKVSLTKELYENFGLFLFVSKAEHGPWSQRMFVFRKEESGDLNLLYSFPVSTGREVVMAGPSGQMYRTSTTPGYYQIDPDRTYRRYHSSQWDHAMPYAMFFNWEHDGLQTGLAIHAADGTDISLLGTRASAGCIRLHPQNAQLLFNLVRKNYRGLAPRFAYDSRTATMANDGLLMHDKNGNLKFADGYKVLVLIENNGGGDVIAALF
jgi:lipoprotein-anchoring transpeptidase ErfK/SrfK